MPRTFDTISFAYTKYSDKECPNIKALNLEPINRLLYMFIALERYAVN